MSLELCCFRHGRTEWNASGRYQGLADVDLDELGRGQALAVAQRCREIAPTALFTSDLRRCSDTAGHITAASGIGAVPDERLRERDVGVWSGITREQIASRYPDEFAAWRAGDENVRPGGGETALEMTARIVDFMDMLRAAHRSVVVAVTHAGWIRTAVQRVLGQRIDGRKFGTPSQGSLTVFLLNDDGSITLEAYNDRGHLLGVQPIDTEPPAPDVL